MFVIAQRHGIKASAGVFVQAAQPRSARAATDTMNVLPRSFHAAVVADTAAAGHVGGAGLGADQFLAGLSASGAAGNRALERLDKADRK